MATVTRLSGRNVQGSRPLDYIYDPVFTVASTKDQTKTIAQNFYKTARRQPIFNLDNLYSTLPHFKSLACQKYFGITDTRIPRPLYRNEVWKMSDFRVNGPNYFKYFFRPLESISSPKQSPIPSEESHKIELPQRKYVPVAGLSQVSVKTQTDYRESEAQTDPYAPDYIYPSGSNPELLTLTAVSYGRGLPAGLATVEMVEQARSKLAWEAALPDHHDFEQRNKRLKLMEKMERREWALREREIHELQQIRLEVWQKMVEQREQLFRKKKSDKLECLWQKKQIEAEKQTNKIYAIYNKKIRHLTKKRKPFKKVKNDICEQYTNYGSTVYAPRPRDGMFPDRNPDSHIVKSNYLNTFEGLGELEMMLPPLDPKPGKIETIPRGFCTKYTRKLDKAVAVVYEGVKVEAQKSYEQPQVPRLLQKLKKPFSRPPTPSVKTYSQSVEMQEQAIIMMQKILRGRFVQVKLLEGRYRQQDLINELRSTHTLQKTEKLMKEEEKQQTIDKQLKHKANLHMKKTVDEFVSQAEGTAIANLLDFLSKELVRLQEERCVHAFVMLAERRRYLREAEEGGRRQLEERRRAEEDEIFKHVIKVHQITVDSYLEDIILSTSEQVADEQTRKEIQKMAEEINNMAYEIEKRRTQLESEEIVADLVHSFLLPEVLKSSAREKVYLRQKRHLLAARELIYRPNSEKKDLFDRSLESGEIERHNMLLEIEARRALKYNHELLSSKAYTNLAEAGASAKDMQIYLQKDSAITIPISSRHSLTSSCIEKSFHVKKSLSVADDRPTEISAETLKYFKDLHQMSKTSEDKQIGCPAIVVDGIPQEVGETLKVVNESRQKVVLEPNKESTKDSTDNIGISLD